MPSYIPIQPSSPSNENYHQQRNRMPGMTQPMPFSIDPGAESDSDQEVSSHPLMLELNPLGEVNTPNERRRNDIGENVQSEVPRFTHFELPPKDRAMRLWTEVRNLDKFLDNVYQYYNGKGMYSILLKRCLNLITVAFVIIFSTFLLGCVDHTKLSSVHESQKTKLGDIVVPECWTSLGVGMKMLLFFVAVIWIWQFVRLFLDVKNLKDLHDFYTYVLEIPDCDIQSISWSDVVNKLIHICATQPSPTIQNITAIDVAHRILRKDNFLVAIFNKDLLDLSLPRNIPFFGNKKWLTKSLEWNLTFCVLNYVFDVDGAIKKRFLSENHRGKLIQGLRRRFVFMGLINAVFSPFIGLFLLMYFFFRYAGEFHRNPGSVGARQYSPLARWKLREFNEMPHLFRLRLNHSFENAMTFLDQFPRERTAAVAGFGAFIAGSFAGVLALATMLNQDILLSLEISPEKSAIFYIGVFGSIFAVAKSMIPDENLFYDPVVLMKGIVMDTHYYPAHWKGKLNTDVVRREFAEMFDYKIVLFLYEILSVVITPLILCYSLPNSSEAIIDFFREFTVHVDGVGYVCSFAAFDFKRHGNTQYGAPSAAHNDYYVSKYGKMEKSFINFKATHPDWNPPETGSMYLSRLEDLNRQLQQRLSKDSQILSEYHSPVNQMHNSIQRRPLHKSQHIFDPPVATNPIASLILVPDYVAAEQGVQTTQESLHSNADQRPFLNTIVPSMGKQEGVALPRSSPEPQVPQLQAANGLRVANPDLNLMGSASSSSSSGSQGGLFGILEEIYERNNLNQL